MELEHVLKKLSNTKITYTQKPNATMNVPYQLTVKGYKKMYLNTSPLPDLSPEEQLILLCASGSDPYSLPENTVAGIYKAREILKRSKNSDEAITKCSKMLLHLNREEFKQRDIIYQEIKKRTMHANLLEYYLQVEKALADYEKQQSSILSPLINLKNRILERITRKPHLGPPFSQDELERGKREWEAFRKEQGAKPDTPPKKVLHRYKYNSDLTIGTPFSYLYNVPELSSVSEEYAIGTIAFKIIDGSAYQIAVEDFNKNSSQYLMEAKSKSR